ncbi:hypothetical protein HN51_042338 [Arachis hypogaea]|uniref:Uncharacterized protein n=1 Tax=Arachis hypogaea TaxID=3818 RepID=A0A444YWA4_ARAHY|nr:paired amphipathic helix protein-like 2 isoform [Arachis hypogaea]RYR06210.1 hypothetical protein Ahy_B06g085994 [Arachis hypogaea]
MKKEHAPYPGAVRPRFKPKTRSNNKIDKLEGPIHRRQLWRNIKARFKNNLDIFDWIQSKVKKYKNGRKSITELSSDVAVLMRGHPDLINEFNKWIPRTPQDSCTLTTYLENRDLQDKDSDEISWDIFKDIDTDSDAEDNDWISEVTSSTKLRGCGCTDPHSIWKKIKDRFKYNMEICDSLQNKVDKYVDGRKSISQLSLDVAALLRGHPDLIDEFRKWIPIISDNNLQDKSPGDVSETTSISSTDFDSDSDSDSDFGTYSDMSDAMD